MITREYQFKWVLLDSRLLHEDEEKRMNASSYSIESLQVLQTLQKLKKKNIPVVSFREFCDKIFYPPRFKRIYDENGTLFLSSKDILNFVLTGKKVKDLEQDYLVQKNWILVTRSGSVGRVILSNKNFDNIGVSEHVIRVIPQQDSPIGYFYAYLCSSLGQSLLIRKIFGGVVKEIEPFHINDMPIPLLPESDIKEINEKMLEVHKLREEAQDSLKKAEESFHEYLNLPKMNELKVEYFGGEKGKTAKAFSVKSNELNDRLDAYSFNPMFKASLKTLRESGIKIMRLNNVSKQIFLPARFKRPYTTKPSMGLPFLSGSNLVEIKHFDIKYLLKTFELANEYKVLRDWILISARGTLGRPFLVTSFTNGWTASDNILRVIVDGEKALPQYIIAYLLTFYAQVQIDSIKAGSVQDLLQPDQLGQILVPIPSFSVQEKIGNLVMEAYEKKDQANMLENETVKALEEKLVEAAK